MAHKSHKRFKFTWKNSKKVTNNVLSDVKSIFGDDGFEDGAEYNEELGISRTIPSKPQTRSTKSSRSQSNLTKVDVTINEHCSEEPSRTRSYFRSPGHLKPNAIDVKETENYSTCGNCIAERLGRKQHRNSVNDAETPVCKNRGIHIESLITQDNPTEDQTFERTEGQTYVEKTSNECTNLRNSMYKQHEITTDACNGNHCPILDKHELGAKLPHALPNENDSTCWNMKHIKQEPGDVAYLINEMPRLHKENLDHIIDSGHLKTERLNSEGGLYGVISDIKNEPFEDDTFVELWAATTDTVVDGNEELYSCEHNVGGLKIKHEPATNLNTCETSCGGDSNDLIKELSDNQVGINLALQSMSLPEFLHTESTVKIEPRSPVIEAEHVLISTDVKRQPNSIRDSIEDTCEINSIVQGRSMNVPHIFDNINQTESSDINNIAASQQALQTEGHLFNLHGALNVDGRVEGFVMHTMNAEAGDVGRVICTKSVPVNANVNLNNEIAGTGFSNQTCNNVKNNIPIICEISQNTDMHNLIHNVNAQEYTVQKNGDNSNTIPYFKNQRPLKTNLELYLESLVSEQREEVDDLRGNAAKNVHSGESINSFNSYLNSIEDVSDNEEVTQASKVDSSIHEHLGFCRSKNVAVINPMCPENETIADSASESTETLRIRIEDVFSLAVTSSPLENVQHLNHVSTNSVRPFCRNASNHNILDQTDPGTNDSIYQLRNGTMNGFQQSCRCNCQDSCQPNCSTNQIKYLHASARNGAEVPQLQTGSVGDTAFLNSAYVPFLPYVCGVLPHSMAFGSQLHNMVPCFYMVPPDAPMAFVHDKHKPISSWYSFNKLRPHLDHAMQANPELYQSYLSIINQIERESYLSSFVHGSQNKVETKSERDVIDLTDEMSENGIQQEENYVVNKSERNYYVDNQISNRESHDTTEDVILMRTEYLKDNKCNIALLSEICLDSPSPEANVSHKSKTMTDMKQESPETDYEEISLPQSNGISTSKQHAVTKGVTIDLTIKESISTTISNTTVCNPKLVKTLINIKPSSSIDDGDVRMLGYGPTTNLNMDNEKRSVSELKRSNFSDKSLTINGLTVDRKSKQTKPTQKYCIPESDNKQSSRLLLTIPDDPGSKYMKCPTLQLKKESTENVNINMPVTEIYLVRNECDLTISPQNKTGNQFKSTDTIVLPSNKTEICSTIVKYGNVNEDSQSSSPSENVEEIRKEYVDILALLPTTQTLSASECAPSTITSSNPNLKTNFACKPNTDGYAECNDLHNSSTRPSSTNYNDVFNLQISLLNRERQRKQHERIVGKNQVGDVHDVNQLKLSQHGDFPTSDSNANIRTVVSHNNFTTGNKELKNKPCTHTFTEDVISISDDDDTDERMEDETSVSKVPPLMSDKTVVASSCSKALNFVAAKRQDSSIVCLPKMNDFLIRKNETYDGCFLEKYNLNDFKITTTNAVNTNSVFKSNKLRTILNIDSECADTKPANGNIKQIDNVQGNKIRPAQLCTVLVHVDDSANVSRRQINEVSLKNETNPDLHKSDIHTCDSILLEQNALEKDKSLIHFNTCGIEADTCKHKCTGSKKSELPINTLIADIVDVAKLSDSNSHIKVISVNSGKDGFTYNNKTQPDNHHMKHSGQVSKGMDKSEIINDNNLSSTLKLSDAAHSPNKTMQQTLLILDDSSGTREHGTTLNSSCLSNTLISLDAQDSNNTHPTKAVNYNFQTEVCNEFLGKNNAILHSSGNNTSVEIEDSIRDDVHRSVKIVRSNYPNSPRNSSKYPTHLPIDDTHLQRSIDRPIVASENEVLFTAKKILDMEASADDCDKNSNSYQSNVEERLLPTTYTTLSDAYFKSSSEHLQILSNTDFTTKLRTFEHENVHETSADERLNAMTNLSSNNAVNDGRSRIIKRVNASSDGKCNKIFHTVMSGTGACNVSNTGDVLRSDSVMTDNSFVSERNASVTTYPSLTFHGSSQDKSAMTFAEMTSSSDIEDQNQSNALETNVKTVSTDSSMGAILSSAMNDINFPETDSFTSYRVEEQSNPNRSLFIQLPNVTTTEAGCNSGSDVISNALCQDGDEAFKSMEQELTNAVQKPFDSKLCDGDLRNKRKIGPGNTETFISNKKPKRNSEVNFKTDRLNKPQTDATHMPHRENISSVKRILSVDSSITPQSGSMMVIDLMDVCFKQITENINTVNPMHTHTAANDVLHGNAKYILPHSKSSIAAVKLLDDGLDEQRTFPVAANSLLKPQNESLKTIQIGFATKNNYLTIRNKHSTNLFQCRSTDLRSSDSHCENATEASSRTVQEIKAVNRQSCSKTVAISLKKHLISKFNQEKHDN
ncbi:hypothetical protein DPMN_181222 [Dreissena polymorpha]|uniref:Uncharacterized protein n=1 Tax=Dreissena polymorpha TaxID=45954 RepID=A0A9D4DD96_DREPO|nr:hypothetical protein DPMN_181222 [Dreissena polymorpha]